MESVYLFGTCKAVQVRSGFPDLDGKVKQRAGTKALKRRILPLIFTSCSFTSFPSQWHPLVGMAKSQESLNN